jgi:hypothetical protein
MESLGLLLRLRMRPFLLLSAACGTCSIFDCIYCIRTNGLYFNIMR